MAGNLTARWSLLAAALGILLLIAGAAAYVTTRPSSYFAGLPVLFQVDPIRKTMTTLPQPGTIRALGVSGSVLSNAPQAFTLSTSPDPTNPTAPLTYCDGARTGPSVTVYPPAYIQVNDKHVAMSYMFTLVQYDNARWVSGANGPHQTRQYLECMSGGGITKSSKQHKDGAGSTMEDSRPVFIDGAYPFRVVNQAATGSLAFGADSPAR